MENETNQIVNINTDMRFMKGFADWAYFKAVIDIVIGALSCLSFILILPAVYGVLKIIAGIKLINACDSMKLYISTNQPEKVAEVFYNLHKHFKLTGISIIIQISGGIILVIIYILVAVFAIMNADSINGFDTSGFY